MHRLIRFLCVFLSLCLLTAAGVTVAATVRLERYARAAEESPPVIPDLRGIGEPSVLYAYDPEDRAAARGEVGCRTLFDIPPADLLPDPARAHETLL